MDNSQADRIAWRRYLALFGGGAGLATLTVALLTVTDRTVLDRSDADGNVTLMERPDDGGFQLCVNDGAHSGGLIVTSDDEVTNVFAETCDGDPTNLQILATEGESLYLIGTGETRIVGGNESAASVVDVNEDGVTMTTDDQDLRLIGTLLSWTRDGSSWAMGPTMSPRKFTIDPLASDPHNQYVDIYAPVQALSIGNLRHPIPTKWARNYGLEQPPTTGVPTLMASVPLHLTDRPWTVNGHVKVTVLGIADGVGDPEVTLNMGVGESSITLGSCIAPMGTGPWKATATLIRLAEDAYKAFFECVYASGTNTLLSVNNIEMSDTVDNSIDVLLAQTVAADIQLLHVSAEFVGYTATQENPSIEDGEIGP